jgi:hypothetical protein
MKNTLKVNFYTLVILMTKSAILWPRRQMVCHYNYIEQKIISTGKR